MITYSCRDKLFQKLIPFWDLACRLFMADIFLRAGLSKVDGWEATLFIFREEYCVPCMPAAAYVATGVELIAPIMLAVGLGSRLAAFALFIVSIVVHVTYPTFSEHYLWMLICLGIVLKGPGKFSLDRLLCREMNCAAQKF
jgi:putative oxidoreductase